jgi:hypothetical protein
LRDSVQETSQKGSQKTSQEASQKTSPKNRKKTSATPARVLPHRGLHRRWAHALLDLRRDVLSMNPALDETDASNATTPTPKKLSATESTYFPVSLPALDWSYAGVPLPRGRADGMCGGITERVRRSQPRGA